jgi:hypothetical protein
LGDVGALDKLLSTKVLGVSAGLVFCGSRMGDSSLLGYTLESNATLVDTMQGKGNVSNQIMAVKGENDLPEAPPQAIDEYELILRSEEDALYALDDDNDKNPHIQEVLPDVIPPSDEENDEISGGRHQFSHKH